MPMLEATSDSGDFMDELLEFLLEEVPEELWGMGFDSDGDMYRYLLIQEDYADGCEACEKEQCTQMLKFYPKFDSCCLIHDCDKMYN